MIRWVLKQLTPVMVGLHGGMWVRIASFCVIGVCLDWLRLLCVGVRDDWSGVRMRQLGWRIVRFAAGRSEVLLGHGPVSRVRFNRLHFVRLGRSVRHIKAWLGVRLDVGIGGAWVRLALDVPRCGLLLLFRSVLLWRVLLLLRCVLLLLWCMLLLSMLLLRWILFRRRRMFVHWRGSRHRPAWWSFDMLA